MQIVLGRDYVRRHIEDPPRRIEVGLTFPKNDLSLLTPNHPDTLKIIPREISYDTEVVVRSWPVFVSEIGTDSRVIPEVRIGSEVEGLEIRFLWTACCTQEERRDNTHRNDEENKKRSGI